jgi:hypothetical protein
VHCAKLILSFSFKYTQNSSSPTTNTTTESTTCCDDLQSEDIVVHETAQQQCARDPHENVLDDNDASNIENIDSAPMLENKQRELMDDIIENNESRTIRQLESRLRAASERMAAQDSVIASLRAQLDGSVDFALFNSLT